MILKFFSLVCSPFSKDNRDNVYKTSEFQSGFLCNCFVETETKESFCFSKQ